MKTNWRNMVGKKQEKGKFSWRIYMHKEFYDLIEEVAILAHEYKFSLWGGKVGNYAITLYQGKKHISVKLMNDYKYHISFKDVWNPNNLKDEDYSLTLSESLDEALKYVHTYLIENTTFDNKDLTIIMGGAYDRYPLALKWEKERVSEELLENELIDL